MFPTQLSQGGKNACGHYNATQHNEKYDKREGRIEEENSCNWL